uniref:Uncharacterized protein n=1 Tax=Anguilla anguilla TaxID=7936 RepID=A0A0E9Y1G2_ANGAN
MAVNFIMHFYKIYNISFTNSMSIEMKLKKIFLSAGVSIFKSFKEGHDFRFCTLNKASG